MSKGKVVDKWQVVEFKSNFVGVVYLIMKGNEYFNYSTNYRAEAQELADKLNGVK